MPSSPKLPSSVDAWTTASTTSRSAARKSTTVVFLRRAPLKEPWKTLEPWMKLVSKDDPNARTVFLRRHGNSFGTRTYSDGKQIERPSNADLTVAAAAVAKKFPNLRMRNLTFDTEKGPRAVKTRSTIRSLSATKILTQEGLKARIDRENVDTLNSLVEQLRSPLGVIPFVGAGMSAGIEFPTEPKWFLQWGKLLEDMADGRTIEPQIKRLVKKGEYERAAQMLDKDCPNFLPSEIKDAFDRDVNPNKLESGALSYIPFLTKGPVITTNFDRVLEQVFEVANKRLEIISGPKHLEIASAIHQNRLALLKIHGDCRDSTFRVLTVNEYEAAYGGADGNSSRNHASIGSLAWLMFTNRPLLCLGCSLETDRTTHVLRALKKELPGLTHYAILARNYSLHCWEKREKQLRDMGVRPLWYAPGDYKQITSLLQQALEQSSTRILARVKPVVAVALKPDDNASASKAFRDLKSMIAAQPLNPPPTDLLESVTSAMRDGKLAFFLGAFAHLDNSLFGDEFYNNLATKFECPKLAGDRAAVASYIVSHRGSRALWREVKEVISRAKMCPSPVHRLLAALPNVLRGTKKGNVAPLWVFTTNYDTAMEEAMTAAGQRFHLLYYSGGTAEKYHGLFIERSADGVVRVIEHPENLRSIDGESNVIVKLNGGLVHNEDFPESVLTASGHFERFAAAIPAALPLYLRNALREKSLLFLGHGLREPDVDALIQYSGSEERTIKSWAIQIPPAPEWRPAWKQRREHFRSWGLQTVTCDLRQFIGALHEEWVETLLPPDVSP